MGRAAVVVVVVVIVAWGLCPVENDIGKAVDGCSCCKRATVVTFGVAAVPGSDMDMDPMELALVLWFLEGRAPPEPLLYIFTGPFADEGELDAVIMSLPGCAAAAAAAEAAAAATSAVTDEIVGWFFW